MQYLPLPKLYCLQLSGGQVENCESVFFCSEFTQHPDEKMRLREQKNKIKALETSETKLEQELTSQEAAFDSVQGSVNKQLEGMIG